MKLMIKDGLPFVSVTLGYKGQQITLSQVLLDTGSASSIFQTDRLLEIGLSYEPEDIIHRIRGIGGAEFVFTKEVDELNVGDLSAPKFEIEVGAMDYGLELHGILGMDFLTQVGAIIDLDKLEILGG